MKNYLVTGGSKGIGQAAIDLLLQDKNNNVFNIDITDSNNKKNLTYIKADLINQLEISDAISQIKDIQFDGIFFNAGILVKGSVFDISIEDIKKVLDINVWSIIHIIKGLKHSINNGASIVINGSDQCFVAKPDSFAYTMSKGAIAQMTKSLAIDLAKYQIRVNAVCPGTVDTDLYRDLIQKYADNVGISFEQAHKQECQEFPLNTIAQPQDIADLVMFLLSEKSRFMTGSLVPIDGGYTAR
ncbi:short-chain dehydrogenase [Candidatus Francisella endociliophora]|uniref:Short-chain dehydrogenase n=1 Tax=Candidatus Francisella endociliophora TaxID=653937 RepID=A0A097EM99_9GAMM|nr:SDR family oxidoreductase [Francisella sp. FSC1006]AIT08673.1 short-chain dehydrogenase [Francisella sp. FSC1006]